MSNTDHLSAAIMTEPSRFLALPAEMRNRIYRALLVADEPIEANCSNIKACIALLRTSKQIRAEATAIFYAENKSVATVSGHESCEAIVSTMHWIDASQARLIFTLFIEFTKRGGRQIRMYAGGCFGRDLLLAGVRKEAIKRINGRPVPGSSRRTMYRAPKEAFSRGVARAITKGVGK